MKRKGDLFVGILLATITICTACGSEAVSLNGSDASETSGTEKNNLNMVMGGSEERNIVLDASKVSDCTLKQDYEDEIVAFLSGASGYEKENKEFIQQIKEMVADKASCLYGEKQVHISKFPVFEWSAEKNEIIYNYPRIIVFSKDCTKAATFELTRESGKYESYSFGNIETKFFNTLNESKEKEYLFFVAYEQEEFLSSQNKLIELNGLNSNTVEVKGDYYQTFKDSGITISMNKLTADFIDASLSK